MAEDRTGNDDRLERESSEDRHGGSTGPAQTGWHGRGRDDLESDSSVDAAARDNLPGGEIGGGLTKP